MTATVRLALAEELAALDPVVKDMSGAVVVLEPSTGELVAEVSDPNSGEQGLTSARRSREVGSLFKPVLLAAALESGYQLEARLGACPLGAPATAADHPFGPAAPQPGLAELLEVSTSTRQLEITQCVGSAKVAEVAKKFGFTADVEEAATLPLTAHASLVEVAQAWGQIAAAENGTATDRTRPRREDLQAIGCALRSTPAAGLLANSGLEAPVAQVSFGRLENEVWLLAYVPRSPVVGVWLGGAQPRARAELGAAAQKITERTLRALIQQPRHASVTVDNLMRVALDHQCAHLGVNSAVFDVLTSASIDRKTAIQRVREGFAQQARCFGSPGGDCVSLAETTLGTERVLVLDIAGWAGSNNRALGGSTPALLFRLKDGRPNFLGNIEGLMGLVGSDLGSARFLGYYGASKKWVTVSSIRNGALELDSEFPEQNSSDLFSAEEQELQRWYAHVGGEPSYRPLSSWTWWKSPDAP